MGKRGGCNITLFLIAIYVAGLLDRLLGSDGSNSVGNDSGQDEFDWVLEDVPAFFQYSKKKDTDLLASRMDIQDGEAATSNLLQRFRRAAPKDESDSDEAKRWLALFGEEFKKFFGTVEVQQVGAQGEWVGAGAGAGESGASLVTGGETTTSTVSLTTLETANRHFASIGGEDFASSSEIELFASVGTDKPLKNKELFPHSSSGLPLSLLGVFNAVTPDRAEELKVQCSILVNEHEVFCEWTQIVSRS